MLMPHNVGHERAVGRGGRTQVMIVGLAAMMMMMDVGAISAQSGTPPVPPVPPVTRAPEAPRAPRVAPVLAPVPAPVLSLDPWLLSTRIEALTSERLADIQFRASEMAMQVASQQPYAVDAIRSSAQAVSAASAQIAMEASSFARASVEAAMPAMYSGTEQFSVGYAPLVGVDGSFGRTIRSQAPTSWDADDPADSLYREARKALSTDAYRRAVELFRKIRDQYPTSTYAPDAPYWEAFALQRLGGMSDLRAAMDVLTLQQQKYPRAATRGDANALKTRIEGQLARGGDQQATDALIRRTQTGTSDGCLRAKDDERVDALNAVAQIDAEKAMPILKSVLARREPCTKELRKTAVWLIASKKQPEAASILLNVAKTDPDKDVREQAVFWMANVPTEEATTMLIELAKKNDNLELQQRAILSLSRSKSPRAATTIREIALDPNADVDIRRTALSYYMNGPGKTIDNPMSFLKEVYGKADSREFKSTTLDMIARQKTDEARAFLVEVAQNSRESMEARRSAISSLRSSGVTAAELSQIYDRGGEVEVRKQIISVLGGLRDNAGVDKLLDIARNDKNPELQKQSMTYLIRSKDPRALQLLQEIVNR